MATSYMRVVPATPDTTELSLAPRQPTQVVPAHRRTLRPTYVFPFWWCGLRSYSIAPMSGAMNLDPRYVAHAFMSMGDFERKEAR